MGYFVEILKLRSFLYKSKKILCLMKKVLQLFHVKHLAPDLYLGTTLLEILTDCFIESINYRELDHVRIHTRSVPWVPPYWKFPPNCFT